MNIKQKTKSFEGTVISTSEAMIDVVDNYFSDSLSAVEKSLLKLEGWYFTSTYLYIPLLMMLFMYNFLKILSN